MYGQLVRISVSILRDSGSTRVSLSTAAAAAGSREFLAAVQHAAAGEFVVLGEMGRAGEDVAWSGAGAVAGFGVGR